MDLFSSFSFFPTFFAQSIFDRDKQQKAHKTQKLVKPEIYCVSKSLSNFKASPKLYIPSTPNTDNLLWHTKPIVCAAKY